MQAREKRLLYVVGALGIVLAAVVGVMRVANLFDARDKLRQAAQNTLNEQSQKLLQMMKARDKKLEYERRSLPSDSPMAVAAYQALLVRRMTEAGWQDPSVTAQPPETRSDVYRKLVFDVAGHGTLEQLVTVLHRFYSNEHLAQFTKLNITPSERTRDLQFDIRVEALILPGASQEKQLPEGSSKRLTYGDLAEYRRVIETRNLFGPPNRAPTLERITAASAKVGQPLTFTARAKDEDAGQTVSYGLEGVVLDGATIDAKTGRFRWLPPSRVAPGDYQVTVRATDSGTPPRSASQVVKLTIEPYGLRLPMLLDRTIEPEKEFTMTIKPSEADPQRKLTFSLEGTPPPGATLETATGVFRWTPESSHDGQSFPVTVQVVDDAVPQHRDSKSFKLTVARPKAQDLTFDFTARHTFLTAIVENGQPEAWFRIRPTGEMIKLPNHDAPPESRWTFRAGSFTGRVVEIRKTDVIVESQGKTMVIELGKSLADYALPPTPEHAVRADKPDGTKSTP